MKNLKWKLFEKELPTEILGKQVDILFGHPKWATFVRGMYSHMPDEDLRERLSQYMPDIDKFYSWDSMVPTHWMQLPNNPRENKNDAVVKTFENTDLTWMFFYEGNEDNPEFEVHAQNAEQAYYFAFDNYGPQVDDLFYKIKQ